MTINVETINENLYVDLENVMEIIREKRDKIEELEDMIEELQSRYNNLIRKIKDYKVEWILDIANQIK